MEFDSSMATDLRPFIGEHLEAFDETRAIRLREGIIEVPMGDTLQYGEVGLYFAGESGSGKTTTAHALVEEGPAGSRFLREDSPTVRIGSDRFEICISGDLEDSSVLQGFQEISDGTARFLPVAAIFWFGGTDVSAQPENVEVLETRQFAEHYAKRSSIDPTEERRRLDYVSRATAQIPCFLVGEFPSPREKVSAVLEKIKRICGYPREE
ncbi:hypothetical protein MRY87_02360 [bacterium]|nr:hypothetical protein [bacterium]